MIPTAAGAKRLWDTYGLSYAKRVHVEVVSRVALFFAYKLLEKGYEINIDLLRAACLLHDIDKNVPKKPGERHPDGAVRILRKEGMEEVAKVVERHSLHTILDASLAPKTWEEKLLYLADKMVKQEAVGVDGRFALWKAEPLPYAAQVELSRAYPKVKALEREICHALGIAPDDVTNRLSAGILPV